MNTSKFKWSLFLLMGVLLILGSCNDYETYGDQKEKERNAISKFIADSSITVISEDQFVAAGYVTNLQRNEFVKLDKSGVYMQIINRGSGSPIQDGQTLNIVCRYTEFNILTDTITAVNNTPFFSTLPDVMRVTRTSGSYSATFVKGTMLSTAYSTSGSSVVPAGWLVPMNYVNVGRPQSDTDEIARVRLIVPHTQGHTSAQQSVVPMFYVITYEREA